jgi:hypothetical protein
MVYPVRFTGETRGSKNMLKICFFFSRQGILVLCLLIVSGLILQSCFGTNKNRRGKLSDAMEESSDEHKGERKVDTKPDPDYEDDDEDYVIGIVSEPDAYVETDSAYYEPPPEQSVDIIEGKKNTWLTIGAGTGVLREEDLYGLNHFNLALGTFIEKKHYLELLAGLSGAPIQETSLLSESLDNGVVVFQLGLGYKYFFTPPHTFLGIYFCAGLGYAYMRWSYKNPFQAMAYDEYGDELGMETISSDGVSGFEMYTGLGLNVVQTEKFQLGGEVLPGFIAWGGETSEGFDNDVFDTFYYTKLKIFIRFGW